VRGRKPKVDNISNIENVENEIRNQDYETAILYDKNGKQVIRKDGGKSQVGFTGKEVEMMKDGVLTHNHPGSMSFSYADIEMLRYGELKEIRAVGTDYSYSFKTSDLIKRWGEGDIKLRYRVSVQKAQKMLKSGTARHGTLEEVFGAGKANMLEGTHLTMKNLAEMLGAEYSRIPIN
jgi:hypothetical protein